MYRMVWLRMAHCAVIINEILNNQNNKTVTGNVFCDLQKTLDTVNHDSLSNKLQYYGIKRKAKKLLESYLQNRYQRVQITTPGSNRMASSTWIKITQRVPQGSILHPVLFLIYVNDLPKVVEPTAIRIMFADDTSILMKSHNNIQLQCELNIVMSQINKWFQDNLITFNLEKTCFIQFSNKNTNDLDIHINIKKKNIATVN